jgi:hypothetical protein
VIDLDARVVERWRPTDVAPERVTGAMEWRPVGSAGPYRIEWVEFFAAAE